MGAAIEFMIAFHNNETLQENEALGYYNKSDEQLVQTQFTCATILLLLAAVSFAIAVSAKEKRESVQMKPQPHSPPPPSSFPSTSYTYRSGDTKEDIYEKMKTLRKMRDEGFITNEEYEEKRKELLSKI